MAPRKPTTTDEAAPEAPAPKPTSTEDVPRNYKVDPKSGKRV